MASSSSSSALLRLLYPKGFAGSSSSSYWNLWKWTARSGAGCFNRRGLTTAASEEAVRNQDSSPLLMLPPVFEGCTMTYKFYSLAENKVQTHIPIDVIRNLSLTYRGSSRGWLALLSPFNEDFFLYNPVTHRHIKLPSVHNLRRCPDAPKDVTKVILSCSPDEDEENCRAVIVGACSDALAFCCPGRSKEWTLMRDEKRGRARSYIDCVYSTRQKLFFGLTFHSELETWDLRDPSSPRLTDVVIIEMYSYYNFSTPERALCGPGINEHLVVAKQQEDLLLVIQYLMEYVGPDGSCFDHLDERRPEYCPHMTVDFDIFKYDPEKRSFECVDRSYLGGLALFIGFHNHSVAVPATHCPELKSNSIYFTDTYVPGTLTGELIDDDPFGGHDIGVFNYGNRTVSPCYYPCDVPSQKRILPAPMWFFPSRPI